MKKSLLIVILFLNLGCTKKIIETRIVTDYDLFKKSYTECLNSYGKLDSLSLKYYQSECKKDAMSRSAKMKKYLIVKKGNKIIKEQELLDY